MCGDKKVAETIPAESAQILFQIGLPDRLHSSLWGEKDHILFFVNDQPFDEHQADKGFAKAYSIAEKCAVEGICDFDQIAVTFVLIPVQDTKHPRL